MFVVFGGCQGASLCWEHPKCAGVDVDAAGARWVELVDNHGSLCRAGIRVSTSGNFSFTGETHGTFDNVEFLYNSSFNAATPLTGFLRGVNGAGFGGTETMTAIPLMSNAL